MTTRMRHMDRWNASTKVSTRAEYKNTERDNGVHEHRYNDNELHKLGELGHPVHGTM
jgi:hypothetical protein